MTPPDPDPFALQRFLDAQDRGASYERALAELRAGRKASHWMWFVFPQLAGLGRSAMAQRYAISGRDEALAYAAHPELGARLRACADALTALPEGRGAVDILGPIDAQKLHSSMTLFALAVPDEPVFDAVLQRYFCGQHDTATVRLL